MFIRYLFYFIGTSENYATRVLDMLYFYFLGTGDDYLFYFLVTGEEYLFYFLGTGEEYAPRAPQERDQFQPSLLETWLLPSAIPSSLSVLSNIFCSGWVRNETYNQRGQSVWAGLDCAKSVISIMLSVKWLTQISAKRPLKTAGPWNIFWIVYEISKFILCVVASK